MQFKHFGKVRMILSTAAGVGLSYLLGWKVTFWIGVLWFLGFLTLYHIIPFFYFVFSVASGNQLRPGALISNDKFALMLGDIWYSIVSIFKKK